MSFGSADFHRRRRATRQLIAANGGLEGAAATVGRGKSQMSRYQDPHSPDSIPADAIAALEETAVRSDGWPWMTRELARLTGHALVRLPAPDSPPADGPALLRALGEHAASAHAASEAVLAAVADGRVCAKDQAKCDAEIDALISAAVALRAAVGDAADAGGRV